MGKIKVLYILAFARSGTTLLGNLLGEVDGFLHVGELYRFWPRMLRTHRNKCGCQRPLPECPFWSRIRETVLARFGSPETLETGILESRDRAMGVAGWRNLLSNRMKAGGSPHLPEFVQVTEMLYQCAASASGSRVIVDSSKLPKLAGYMRRMDSIDPYYVHVVRDPRGCVFSRQRLQAARENGKVLLRTRTATMDTVRWMRTNLTSAALCRSRGAGRHVRIMYEDFASRPVTALRRILELVGEESASLPFVDDRTAVIGPQHTVCGNKNRFETGTVTLRLDDRWVSGLRAGDHRLVTTMTAPLLVHYGYPLGHDTHLEKKISAV